MSAPNKALCPHCGISIDQARLERHLHNAHTQEKLEQKARLEKSLEELVLCEICKTHVKRRDMKTHENQAHRFKELSKLKGKPFVVSHVERACSCCNKIKTDTYAYLEKSNNVSKYLCRKCKTIINQRTAGKKIDALDRSIFVAIESNRRKH